MVCALMMMVFAAGQGVSLPATLQFEGNWRGQGTAWQNGEPTQVTCRLTVTPESKTDHRFEGRCGTSAGVEPFAFALSLQADGDARVRPVATAPDAPDPVDLAGQWTPESITLSGRDTSKSVVMLLEEILVSGFTFFVQEISGEDRVTLRVAFQRS